MREKQIEEMARVIHDLDKNYNNVLPSSLADCVYKHGGTRTAEAVALYEAGYRKQSEGEWIKQVKVRKEGRPKLHYYKCSLCGVYIVKQANFCPNCGSKMKGGTE